VNDKLRFVNKPLVARHPSSKSLIL